MQPHLVSGYRPRQNRLDRRPAVLVGGYVTSDAEDLAVFAATLLAERGNLVIQRTSFPDDNARVARYAYRALEAERAERRPS